MQYSHIPGIKKPVSRLVQGCIMFKEEEAEWAFGLLDAVFELGVTTFDIANVYGGGQCERVVGRWMEARGNRDKVVILTKGAHHNKDRRRVTSFDIAADLHDSFARLRTDYIDLYVLHRDDPDVPVGPIVETLNEYRAAGRIHAFGGSNWRSRRIEEANEYANKHGLVPFAVSSPNFSLAEQFDEPWADCVTISGPKAAEDRAWYARQGMPLFTWSSLAQGFFSGKITRENLEALREVFPEPTIRCYCHEPNFKRLDRVRELGKEKGLTVPQVALAFILHQPGLNVHALTGCFSGDEFRENLKALDTVLRKEEIDWLDLRRDTRPWSSSADTLVA